MANSKLPTPLGCQLPPSWRLETLGQMCTKIGSGATPKGGAAAYTKNGISFIRSQNVLDHSFRREGLAFINYEAAMKLGNVAIESRDVLLNITGDGETIARCCVVPDEVLPARVNQHVVIIRPTGELLPEYLQRYLSHPSIRQYILSHNSGGSRRAITKAHVEKFAIVVPPAPDQLAISTLLGTLDRKIAINEQVAATGGALATSLASDEQWLEHTILGELVQNVRDQVQPEFLESDRVAHYSLPAFDAAQVPEVVPPNSIKSGKLLVTEACILLSKLNPSTPRIWHVEPSPELPSLASTEFLVLTPLNGTTPAELWAVCAQPSFSDALTRNATGTSNSHQRVRPADVLATQVVNPRVIAPNVRKQLRILATRSLKARLESVTLRQLRDTLLPKLMSGELRVRDAEKVVEEAT